MYQNIIDKSHHILLIIIITYMVFFYYCSSGYSSGSNYTAIINVTKNKELIAFEFIVLCDLFIVLKSKRHVFHMILSFSCSL